MSKGGCALHSALIPVASSPHCRRQRRIGRPRLWNPSIARAAAATAAAADATTATSVTSSSVTSSTTKTKPILIVFDLDNAPIPSQTPASAVVSVLARKMGALLFDDEDDDVADDSFSASAAAAAAVTASVSVRAEAFANETTVRNRPDLPLSLSAAGISLLTVPSSIRNAADAMVVSCASRAIPSLRAAGGGLVLVGNDVSAYADFLRFASSRDVVTLVAGDFDHRNKGVGRRGGSAVGRGGGRSTVGRRRLGGRSGGGGGSDSELDDAGVDAAEAAATTAPWRRRELPAAADHAVLWCDVLSEARELTRP